MNQIISQITLGIIELLSGKISRKREREPGKKEYGRIEEHYRKNVIAWQEYRESHGDETYIEGQCALRTITYGRGITPIIDRWILGDDKAEKLQNPKDIAASKNACEVIALYNALQYLGNKTFDFPQLLKEFELNGITLKGIFGTSPLALLRFINQKTDCKAVRIKGDYLEGEREKVYLEHAYETYLFSFWNDAHSILKGIHTVCITYNGGKYSIHNLYGNYRVMTCEGMKEALELAGGKKSAICLIGVRAHGKV